MKKVKYINNKPTFVDEDSNDDGKLRIGGKTVNEILAMGSKSKPSGNISSRTDFSDDKIAPKFKAPKKINKEPVKEKVETPSGDIGSVDRTDDVIGPDMSKITIVDEEKENKVKAAREFTAMEMAQNLMSPGYNKKKGGMIKTKKMSSGGSTASKRADGCAQRGKTKGKIC